MITYNHDINQMLVLLFIFHHFGIPLLRLTGELKIGSSKDWPPAVLKSVHDGKVRIGTLSSDTRGTWWGAPERGSWEGHQKVHHREVQEGGTNVCNSLQCSTPPPLGRVPRGTTAYTCAPQWGTERINLSRALDWGQRFSKMKRRNFKKLFV